MSAIVVLAIRQVLATVISANVSIITVHRLGNTSSVDFRANQRIASSGVSANVRSEEATGVSVSCDFASIVGANVRVIARVRSSNASSSDIVASRWVANIGGDTVRSVDANSGRASIISARISIVTVLGSDLATKDGIAIGIETRAVGNTRDSGV